MALNPRTILGQADLAATTETVIYTAPTAESGATLLVYFVNRTGSPINVRIGLSPGGGALADAEYVLFDRALPANDTEKYGPFVIGPDDEVRCEADAVDTSVLVSGIEHG